MPTDSRNKFLSLLRTAVADDTLVKLTLARHRGADATLKNLLVRPLTLKSGRRLGFTWRYETKDIAKNHAPDEGLALIEPLIGKDFLDGHLFTKDSVNQLECDPSGKARLHSTQATYTQLGSQSSTQVISGNLQQSHDKKKAYAIPAEAPWLRELGITNESGRPREGMAPKFRQIQNFAELLRPLLAEAGLDSGPVSVTDMGCGKGYLTFAVSQLLGDRGMVRGIEVRPELVDLCNRVARDSGLDARLKFESGTISGSSAAGVNVLIALHACDTATDDALAKGIEAGAKLLVVAPCCQKELRPQLKAPPVLAPALRHGIFQERQAEFVTDALRGLLLEWAGYRTKVFEFISTEHTPKNLMIAGIKTEAKDEAAAGVVREFAAFYGIKNHALARALGFYL